MGVWKAAKAKRVLRALLNTGWEIKVQRGSHRKLIHADGRQYTFAFHDKDEIGPALLAEIAKCTDLKPEDI